MPQPLATALALAAVAFCAGVTDAIAGGGGLLTMPALLVFLPAPRLALGTNKGQAIVGAVASLVSFARAGHVDRARAGPTFVASLLGSLAGVQLVFAIRPETLRPVVVVLLLGVAVFFALPTRRRRGAAASGGDAASSTNEGLPIARRHPLPAAAAIALLLGVYDGFFGPGTGTFLITLFATVLGDDLTRASANAKVANFASNLGAVVSFAVAGLIDFRLALPMAAAQAFGATLGAHLAIRGGQRVVRMGVLAVSLALVARLTWQLFSGPPGG